MEDWMPGDKAVCVDAAKCPKAKVNHHVRLEKDKIYIVEDVTPPAKWSSGNLCVGLVLAGCHSDNRHKDYCAIRFRKVRHDPAEGSKEDFIALLNVNRSRQPVKVPARPMLPYYGPAKGDTI